VAAAPLLANAEPAPTGAPLAKTQGAGFFSRKIGDFIVSLVSDGTFPMTPAFPTFGQNVGEAPVHAALQREFIEPGKTLGHVNTLLIRNAKDTVLVDTGCGSLFGAGTGKLVSHLPVGSTADITAVVLTHLHPDHIGGLLGEKGADLFPNAQFFLHVDEKAFWSDPNPDFSKSGVPADAAKQMTQGTSTVLKSIEKRLTLLSGSSLKIVDGVEAVPAPGHTPGHIGVQVTSGGDQLLFIADAVHHYAIVMPNPDWYVAFDTDRDAAVAARKALLETAAAERLLISGSHLPFPAFGHVRKAGAGYEWVPSVWEW
jgi:glyoxylase-like metal-dependent hydrolase (beta-lactamase superfamily II)